MANWFWRGILPFILIGLVLLDFRDYLQGHPNSDLELVVWNQPPESQKLERELWEESARGFEEDYFRKTKIHVKVRPVSRDYVQTQFVTVMAGGKGPDVVHVWVGALALLARQGFLANLDQEVSGWDLKNFIPSVIWEPGVIQGHIFGIPFDSYFQTLLIRKDLFRAAGLDPEKPIASWQDLSTTAVRLTLPAKNQYGFGFSPRTDQFIDFLWQAGGDVIRKDAGGYVPAFQENPGVTALEYLRDLRFRLHAMQPNPLASEDEIAQLFALGRLGMMLGVANQMPSLFTRYGMRAEDLGILPLPAGPTGIHASHSGGDYFIINAQSSPEKKKAAWAYIQYVLSPLNQLAKWRRMKELNMPVFPGAFSVATQLLNDPSFKMVQDSLSYLKTEPHLENWPLMKDQLDTWLLQKAFTEEEPSSSDLLMEASENAKDLL